MPDLRHALLSLAALSPLAAQTDRALTFAWPVPQTVVVTNENFRDGKSFTLRYELDVRAGEAEGTLVIGRRHTTVTHWNGKPVPAALRSRLAPLELSMDLLPDLVVGANGHHLSVEPRKSFLERCKDLAAAATKRGVTAQVVDSAIASATRAEQYPILTLQVERQWDEWVGRWLDLDFEAESSASFEGEIELVTGDVVDGTFEVEHLGRASETDDDLVRLRVEFEASGARLDTAALKWRERVFGHSDESFEKVELAVGERTEIQTHSRTMRPVRIESSRTSTVKVAGEPKDFVERRVWAFDWK